MCSFLLELKQIIDLFCFGDFWRAFFFFLLLLPGINFDLRLPQVTFPGKSQNNKKKADFSVGSNYATSICEDKIQMKNHCQSCAVVDLLCMFLQ